MKEQRSWWNPDTSIAGGLTMAAAGFATAYGSMYYFQLDYWKACIVASVVAVTIGIVWNVIAHFLGTKKIHWLDFVWIDLLPW